MKKVKRYLPIIKIAVTAVLLLLGVLLPVFEGIKLGIYIVALIVIGVEPFLKSLKIFVTRSLDENFLMLIAAIGAFILGEYAEGILVLLLSAVGEWFEHYAVNKSRTFISQLVDMKTPYALVLRDGEYVKAELEEIAAGEIMLVKPGERVPLDGIITEGSSTLDASALTGESLPRVAAEGDEVVSGCINLSSAFSMRAEKVYEDSTVAKILDLVENSTSKKAKAENFITKFAKYYTPIVVILAIIVAVFPPLIDGMQWSKWIYKALSFLVISCPCALVISVPLSFFRGIGIASKRGILIKGSNYMEKLARLKVVACDKTGTLTKGNFAVAEIYPGAGYSEEEVMEIARRAESGSNHPIAKSIVGNFQLKDGEMTSFDEIAGRGVRAEINGKIYYGGNALLMEKNGIEYDTCSETGSVVYFGEGNKYVGCIAVKDEIKEDSFDFMSKLKDQQVGRVVMLSGDGERICGEVADKLEIKEYHGGLLPQEKLAYLTKLKNNGGRKEVLAFIGDGINDAPCLAEADVGVAMGGLGSDAAIETADVVIMEDKPSKLADAVKISRRTVRIATENIVFALAVKLAVMVLSLLGITNILIAILADVGVSMLAILNAIRPMIDRKIKK